MLKQLLKECAVGQKRTGYAKQFVFLNYRDCALFPKSVVLKGPYQSGRLELINKRAMEFKKWIPDNLTVPMPVFAGEWIHWPCLLSEEELGSLKTYKYIENFNTEGEEAHLQYCGEDNVGETIRLYPGSKNQESRGSATRDNPRLYHGRWRYAFRQ